MDLGGTKMLLGVLDSDSEVQSGRAARPRPGRPRSSWSSCSSARSRRRGEARPGVAAVGLGIPATIDHDRGIAISAVNLPIDNLPIRELVGERTGLPIFVDNDANVAALAEHLYGAARGADNAVMLTIGTGIGGGLILGGEVYRGATGAGAELGHVVIAMDGLPCQGNCPGHGCVETYASGTALGREGARGGRARARLGARRDARRRARRSTARRSPRRRSPATAAAIGVFDLVGSRLGVALTSFANIFEPEVFVIGGGVIAAGDLLLEPARRELRARALPPMKDTPVVAAELGEDAGMIGAAAMARIELEEGRAG